MGNKIKEIMVTKEIKVNIHGVDYDCLLIPPLDMMEMNYKNCPEEHPKVKRLMRKLAEEDDE